MQTASYGIKSQQSMQTPVGEPLRASVGHLLAQTCALPCSTAAQAFMQLVQPTSRFQLALDALLPLLDAPAQKLTHRILVSYILYSLYAPHPIAMNPFRSALYTTFINEREHAIKVVAVGGISEHEQLVWVLWKILRGDGNDIGPYSPNTLARSPLPPKLRASSLTLDEDTYRSDTNGSHSFGRYDPNANGHSSNSILPNGNGVPGETAAAANGSIQILNGARGPKTTPDIDEQNEKIAKAMKLLLEARERVLTLSEQRIVIPLISELTSPPMITSLDLLPIIAHNSSLAQPLLVALLTSPLSNTDSHRISSCTDVLRHLPPTLPSFDLLGRLLRDQTAVTDSLTGGQSTVADLVRTEVLNMFIHESINWLENAERDEKEGLISDDRFAKGVQNLCRFYQSLIKHSFVDPTSDIESAEMLHFSLRHSRFEDANALYRSLVLGPR